MKNQSIPILLKAAIIILGIYFLPSCGEVDPSVDKFRPPTILLLEPIIQADGVPTLRCSIDVEGSNLSSSGFEYGIKEELEGSKKVEAQLEEDYFYAEIPNFMPGTKYYYRAYIENGINTISTEIENFGVPSMSPIEIGGLTWAASNVDDNNDDDDCWYYTWIQAMSACPDGWRLPTVFELDDLLNSGTTWEDSGTSTTPRNRAGRWLGPDHAEATANNPGRAIFLPASGYRNHNSGNLSLIDKYGSYWSSTPIGDNSWYLSFTRDNVQTENNSRTFGRLVRCVEGLIYSPEVSTDDVIDIEKTTATLDGEVTSDGGTEMIERGFVYSTTNNSPSLGDYNTIKAISILGAGVGEFTKEITGLTASETYYVRAYASNNNGTSYGDVEEFTTDAPAADAPSDAPAYVDGEYSGYGVKIGDTWWAPVNVGYDLDAPHGLLFNWGKNNGFKYDDRGQSSSNGNWRETDQGPCPAGWYVPSGVHYDDLLSVNSPDGTDGDPGQWRRANESTPENVAGRWFGPDCKTATADTPGQAIFLPAAGYWGGIFINKGISGYYWSTTSGKHLNFSSWADMKSFIMSAGMSVRCVYNAPSH